MSAELHRAYAHCETLARSHYENFRIGSFLLPRRARRDLAALYAFARTADDVADEPDFVGDRLAELARIEADLDRALAGGASGPIALAVAHTLRERGLPDEPLRALLRAFRRDAEFAPFRTFDDLLGYCRDSANPVGRLVLGLFGVAEEEALALSDDVCTGLQLANFWQDLSVDLDRGRSHLPEVEVALHAGAARSLADRQSRPGFEALLREQIDRARRFLASDERLAARLPVRAALEVRLFAEGGRRILDRVERLGGRILRERPRLGRADRIAVVRTGLLHTLRSRLRPGAWGLSSDPAAERAS